MDIGRILFDIRSEVMQSEAQKYMM